jgi:hypothetical protein
LEVPVTSHTDDKGPEVVDLGRGLVNPRLSDVFGLVIRQDEVDFVVPHMREDLPLYLDPFLLWKSEDPRYRELHDVLLGFVGQVRTHALADHDIAAQRLLAEVREPTISRYSRC